MIDYRAGRWGLGAVCKFRGSIVPKALVWGAVGALISALGKFAMNHIDPYSVYFSSVQSGDVKWITIWSGFNFVLGFFLVFRAGEAYRRYWEAATLIYEVRGEFYNCASSLVAFTSSSADLQKEVKTFQHRLVRLVSMLFAAALQQVSTEGHFDAECLDLEGFDEEPLESLALTTEKCEVIMQWIQRLAATSIDTGVLSAPAPIVSRAFQELSRGIVKVSNARKIRYIVFPFPFAQVSTLLLMFNLVVTPAICALLLETIQWAAVLSFAVIAPLSCVYYIALDMESPFDDSPNSLPLAETMSKMNESLAALLEPWVQETPSFDMPEMCNQVVRASSAGFLVAKGVRVNLNLRQTLSGNTSMDIDSDAESDSRGETFTPMRSEGGFYRESEPPDPDPGPEQQLSYNIDKTHTEQDLPKRPSRRKSAPEMQMGASKSMGSTRGKDLGMMRTQSLSEGTSRRARRALQLLEAASQQEGATLQKQQQLQEVSQSIQVNV